MAWLGMLWPDPRLRALLPLWALSRRNSTQSSNLVKDLGSGCFVLLYGIARLGTRPGLCRRGHCARICLGADGPVDTR